MAISWYEDFGLAGGTDCIIDIRITDVDAKSQQSRDPHKVLEAHEREKTKNYPRPASSNAGSYLPSWHPWMVYLARNHKPCSRNCPCCPAHLVDTSLDK
jgi:hypothetical protein